jgi:hypothetical protein
MKNVYVFQEFVWFENIYFCASRAFDCIKMFIAADTMSLAVSWNETMGANRVVTLGTIETMFMELLSSVFHFLHAW